jgi:hypothetical protein
MRSETSMQIKVGAEKPQWSVGSNFKIQNMHGQWGKFNTSSSLRTRKRNTIVFGNIVT